MLLAPRIPHDLIFADRAPVRTAADFAARANVSTATVSRSPAILEAFGELRQRLITTGLAELICTRLRGVEMGCNRSPARL